MSNLQPLTRGTDVSYDKLVELLLRLTSATRGNQLQWERDGDEYTLTLPHGVVVVRPAGEVEVWNDSGQRVRHLRVDALTFGSSGTLYDAVRCGHREAATRVIDAMLADLTKREETPNA